MTLLRLLFKLKNSQVTWTLYCSQLINELITVVVIFLFGRTQISSTPRHTEQLHSPIL